MQPGSRLATDLFNGIFKTLRINQNRVLTWCQICRHWWHRRLSYERFHYTNSVVTGRAIGCRYYNPRYHQWQQSWSQCDFCFRWRSKYVSLTKILGLYSLRRHGLIGMGILIINLRRSSDGLMFMMGFLYPSDNEVVGGTLVSLAPSVRPCVRPSARPSRIRCSLCSTYSSSWIHFILIHLIKQLQKVRRVQNFWQFFFNLQLLLCLVLTWDLMWITSIGNHGAAVGISERRRSGFIYYLGRILLTSFPVWISNHMYRKRGWNYLPLPKL